jgi:predicted aldo/keto reductase-like oxidoreductase
MSITRREFLETAMLGSVAVGMDLVPHGGMPTRILGKTGARVSILAMGCGSRFLRYKEEDKALEALEHALDLGVTYLDTSDDYGSDHLSEERIGKVLKGRRPSLFLATKVTSRDGSQTARIVEESLKHLQVEQIDLVHIHSLRDQEDLARIEAKGGVFDQLQRLRDQKLVRFIGITSHSDPDVLKSALQRHDFDCTQMALNAARTGMKSVEGGGMVSNEPMQTSFESLALPVALEKGMGVIAMKVFAGDGLAGKAAPEKLLYYSLSLPVAAAVVGMPILEQIDDSARLAKAFKPLPQSEMNRMSEMLAQKHKATLDRYFSQHIDT